MAVVLQRGLILNVDVKEKAYIMIGSRQKGGEVRCHLQEGDRKRRSRA